MPLDLTSLKKAVGSLERTLNVANSTEKMKQLEIDQQEAIKSGAIQNFEFTYELCWKFIKRFISEKKSPEDAEHALTRKDLFRIAATYNIIQDPLPWFEYSAARNMTSHTYNEDKAADVFEVAKNFIHDAKYLLGKLVELND